MIIDATFWVAISFLIFCGGLVYLKVPQKVYSLLNDKIEEIKNEITEAEKLKEDARNLLSDYENKINNAQEDSLKMIEKAQKTSEKMIKEITEKYYKLTDNKKKSTEQKITQMKEEALKEIKNNSIKITFKAVEQLFKNSIDKQKLNNIYNKDIEQTKNILKKL